MDYTLQQLRYLIAVADKGSVSGAARSLYVSQPGLSAAILHLEDVFGIQLFIRHHAKGVSLTPAGHLFVNEARDVVSRAFGLRQRAKELNQAISGALDIGCHFSIGPLLLPRILTRLHESYPGIDAHIVEGDGINLQSQLKKGTIEVALLHDYYLEPQLDTTPLVTLPAFVLISKGHHLARQASIALQELIGEPLLLFSRPEHGQYVESLFQFESRPTFGHQVASMDLLFGLVAAGKGYSILHIKPAYERAIDGGPVVCVPLREGAPPVTLAVVCAPGRAKTNRVNAFTEICRSTLSGFDARECRWLPERRRGERECLDLIAGSEPGAYEVLGCA